MAGVKIEKITRDIEDFDCGVKSINEYVSEAYYALLAQIAYTYSVVYRDKVVGFYMIMFGQVNLGNFPEDVSEHVPFVIKDGKISAVHIKFIAVDRKYQRNKIGTAIMEIAIQQIRKLSDSWPVRVITIDARCDLQHWYSSLGFKVMQNNNPSQEGVTQAMYFDCMRDQSKLLEYEESIT